MKSRPSFALIASAVVVGFLGIGGGAGIYLEWRDGTKRFGFPATMLCAALAFGVLSIMADGKRPGSLPRIAQYTFLGFFAIAAAFVVFLVLEGPLH